MRKIHASEHIRPLNRNLFIYQISQSPVEIKATRKIPAASHLQISQ